MKALMMIVLASFVAVVATTPVQAQGNGLTMAGNPTPPTIGSGGATATTGSATNATQNVGDGQTVVDPCGTSVSVPNPSGASGNTAVKLTFGPVQMPADAAHGNEPWTAYCITKIEVKKNVKCSITGLKSGQTVTCGSGSTTTVDATSSGGTINIGDGATVNEYGDNIQHNGTQGSGHTSTVNQGPSAGWQPGPTPNSPATGAPNGFRNVTNVTRP